MPVPIIALYAGLLALWVGYPGFRVGSMHGSTGISILHGDNTELAARIRCHANFTESVPPALIPMALIERNGAASTFLITFVSAVVAIWQIVSA